MGLSFHYKGKLKNAATLPEFITEVEDICQVLAWKYDVFNSEYPQNTFVSPVNNEDYGIIFSPPSCEPISFTFDSEGKIYVPWLKDILKKNKDGDIKVITVHLNLDEDGSEPVISERNEGFDPGNLMYQVHVKTQFAGADIHVKVMELIRYLSGKYLVDFELIDESNYYESGDITLLNDKLNSISDFLDKFQDMLGNEKINSPKDFMKLIKKLSREIKKQNDKNKGGSDD